MKRQSLIILLLAAVAWGWAPTAGAQQSTEERLEALEQRVQSLEAGQEGLPTNDFHLAGYMDATYKDPEEGPSSFSTIFNPIFLYKAGDRFLYEGELAFHFDGKDTGIDLEYSQLDYMFSDNATLIAGKFLLPFGIFGERLHPTWINKMPVGPPIYAGHHGTAIGLIPVMRDYGLQLRGGFSTGGLRWTYAAYVAHGPQPVSEDDSTSGVSTHSVASARGPGHGTTSTSGGTSSGGHSEPSTTAPVDWGPWSSDDNNNKAVGFRIGVLPFDGLELGYSYYAAGVSYNDFQGQSAPPGEKKERNITLDMVDFTLQNTSWRLQGEYLVENASELEEYVTAHTPDDPDTTTTDETNTEHLDPVDERIGYWVEGAYRFGGWLPEVALRYGATEEDGEDIGSQTAFGLNWWLESSLVVKLTGIETTVSTHDGDDSTTDYYAQMAFGF